MEDTKKTVLAGNGEKDVPRAVYDGVLTIDVDAQVESMDEKKRVYHFEYSRNCTIFSKLAIIVGI